MGGLLSQKDCGGKRLRRDIAWIADPNGLKDIILGREFFGFPGTWEIMDLIPCKPDIIHCHNLHGGYFDLRVLPWLSKQVPVLITLHDAWLLSGHCAHSLECAGWETGCHQCPDLTIYPPIRRNTSNFNWFRKRQIFLKSSLFIASPSQWLMNKVKKSILAPAMVDSRIIPHGVDVRIFHPGDKYAARDILDIPLDINVLLIIGDIMRSNLWKDFKTFRTALEGLKIHRKTWLLCLGVIRKNQKIGNVEVRFFDFQKDRRFISYFYRASDLYIHPAKADTFPNTILESLACGTPVISTPIGGIPEQVKGWNGICGLSDRLKPGMNRYDMDEATGALIPSGDARLMTLCIQILLKDDRLRSTLAKNAACDAQKRFDHEDQVEGYMRLYADILTRENLCPI